ncbi:kinesin-like protein KIFC3 isoform X2 [Ambystoma mexicanum]|uniref:kinesin-like protein KIFC3 isoform X2 n=1 Tax=Ambystoma mexicanum TaxID=8296 RepID=UPI0037E723D2
MGRLDDLPLSATTRCQPLASEPDAVFTSRKTWNLGTSPSLLQDLWWKKERCASAILSGSEEVTSDEDDGAVLLFPTAPSGTLIQCKCLEWCDSLVTNNLCQSVQALQDATFTYQSTGRSKESSRHRLQAQCAIRPRRSREKSTPKQIPEPEQAGSTMSLEKAGGRFFGVAKRSSVPGGRQFPMIQKMVESMSQIQEEKLQLQDEMQGLQEKMQIRENEHRGVCLELQAQVENLKEKLQKETEEVNRLQSQMAGTDLEKHRDLLAAENERLKREMKSFEAELQALRKRPVECAGCEHSKENTRLRQQVSEAQEAASERQVYLAEMEQEVLQRAERLTNVELQLKESLKERDEIEERLGKQLRECQQAIASLKAQPPQIKYIVKTVEVESSKAQRALSEEQARSQLLQEQVSMQRQVLREMEEQLRGAQQMAARLRGQIQMYEVELERAHGEMVEEMQSMEAEKNRAIEDAFVRAQTEMKSVHENLAGVRFNLLSLQPALKTLTNDYNGLKRQVRDFPSLLQEALKNARVEIGQIIEEVNVTNQGLLRKYRREMQLRKRCHNELVRLKGNIRVFGRVRPVTREDGEGLDAMNVVSFDADDDAILHLSHRGKPVSFELDKVFPSHATQEEVFQEVQALVTSCIDGYHVCIFAYGQTGSGKTYTMEGTPENPGINQRALQLLFTEVAEKASDWQYTISVSMVEIYNEMLRDLLGKDPLEKLDIKLLPDGSGQLYVPGLVEFTVTSVEDINQVFEIGHTNRATECTNLNEHSSRSHALLIITISGVDYSTGVRTTGKLNLVDLAGSERVGKSGAEGSRLREAQHINKSLSALGDVIYALRTRQAHVPFRNSKLTYLLQDSLSGDSKTLMMVQVSPVEKNTSETLCSLKFAERVRSVELGPVTRKTDQLPLCSQEQAEDLSSPIQPHARSSPSSSSVQTPARSSPSSSPGITVKRPSSLRQKHQAIVRRKSVTL